MRILAAAALCAVLGTATCQFRDPCKTRTLTSAHESQCDIYYECHNGQAILMDCPNGLVYSGRSTTGLFGVCDYAHEVDCSSRPGRTLAQSPQQPDPCDSKTLTVGDINNCDQYWACEGRNPRLYNCPNGLVYVGRNRGIADGCDYPWRGSYCNRKQMINPPISTPHCDWLYGVFGHETSCTRYWTCWNGTATEQLCVGGLLYNEDSHACDWPAMVKGCQKHPLCAEAPDAKVPLGKSCERYWSCQGGYPRLQRCAATLVFDKLTRRCVSPPTEDCDIPSTTPAPEGEKQPPRKQRPNKNRRPSQPARPAPPPRRQQIAEPIQDEGFVQDLPPPNQQGVLRPTPIPGAIPLN